MEKKTVDLIQGKKVEEKEVHSDQGKHREVQGSPVPLAAGGAGDVAGRGGHMAYVACPWDGAINYVYVDDYTYIWYRCWRCRGLFSV